MKHYTTLQKCILAATSISYIIVSLDATIVNVALGRMAISLHANIAGERA